MNRLSLQKIEISKFSLGIILFFSFGWVIVNIADEYRNFESNSIAIVFLFAIYFPILHKIKKSKFGKFLKYTASSYYLLLVIYWFIFMCIVPNDWDFFDRNFIPQGYFSILSGLQIFFPISLLYEEIPKALLPMSYKSLLFIFSVVEIIILQVFIFVFLGFLLNLFTFYLLLKLEKYK